MYFGHFAAQNEKCPRAVLCAALAVCGQRASVSVRTLRILGGEKTQQGEAGDALEERLCSLATALTQADAQVVRAVRLPGFTDSQREQKAKLLQGALEDCAKRSSELIELCCEAAKSCETSGITLGHIALGNVAEKVALLEGAGRAALSDVYEKTARMSDKTAAQALAATARASADKLGALCDGIYNNALGRMNVPNAQDAAKDEQ